MSCEKLFSIITMRGVTLPNRIQGCISAHEPFLPNMARPAAFKDDED